MLNGVYWITKGRGILHESFSTEYYIRRENEMRGTFKARHEIWLRGGRGGWSTGDESRFVWPPPAPPARPKTTAPRICWGNRTVWATDMQAWRENL